MSLALTRAPREKMPWPMAVAIALCLSGVAAVGAKPAAAPSAQPQAAAPAPSGADEDNDLLEHWDDPKYAQEERRQLPGLIGVFVAAGIYRAVRRRKIRRDYVKP